MNEDAYELLRRLEDAAFDCGENEADTPEFDQAYKTLELLRPKILKLLKKAMRETDEVIEFNSENGGGLISFRLNGKKLIVAIYQHDKNVIVKHGRRSGM